VDAALARWEPWAVVNAAGYARVGAAEQERAACWRENVCGAQTLAEACAARGVRLVAFSTDLVFDGETERPYVESDRVAPLGAYGTSKATGEALTRQRCPDALVVRTAALFGPREESSVVARWLAELLAGRPIAALDDVTVTPTYLPELADAVLDLLIDGERGVWHLTNDGALTWAELARMVARRAGADPGLVRPVALAEAVGERGGGLVARRPRYSALASERGRLLGPVENAICQYVTARTRACREPDRDRRRVVVSGR
jgi:dTDP-4-dehydrorhamnose reductase